MNIFTTEHPLTVEAPRFSETHPMLALLRNAFVLGLIFMPGIFAALYEFAIRDIGAEPTPFPEPGLALVVGISVAFVLSFVSTAAVLFAYRMLIRFFRLLTARLH
jgi:hypothetical protein